MITGCFTALVTPFKNDSVDYEGLSTLIDFQIANGITGILAVGTTGESPTLTWDEHNGIIEKVTKKSKGTCLCIAGTGSNNTKEALAATKHAANVGVDAVLLVDPYYNGPSSLEIRKEYIGPVASAFPDIHIIPYVIPGRTGTQLLPEDLALLYKEFSNVDTVKEATGNIENMKRTRKCCGTGYTILSGDDGLTYDMITDPEINAAGVISVITNIAPKAIAQMVNALIQGNKSEAKQYKIALDPLFELVTVKTMEKTPYGDVVCRARNPLAIKAAMTILGMPSGGCRRPLGKLTRNGLEKVIDVLRNVQNENPEIFKPVEDFFNINIEKRLKDNSFIKDLCYQNY
ncbi:MAG: 4-hydroxy-tetrahydrodipicolinate synthase [Desulfobacterium sp.]|nr:4-hydroxy-tetrahydrodipicolinate synthase [Desulfobacterium sp.]MBU3948608.1 4-hydroxy-tetrahydrodipicolinate synthase [Pseudomonadota bacterium]MBU4009651.1 4-hydroxy-tetrahydrodipicolinate synthase [Pseudomonadota bacterium]MBU4036830.1 4-hydroxy-tetrahydrodipicolinate synthase [Pseudomonadota bacterium]